MIIVDLSQVMISNIMAQAGSHADAIEQDLVRHMVVNKIRELRVKFHKQYGDIVLAADSRQYWRRDFFPEYKGTRKIDREKSGIDWQFLFDTLNMIKEEIKDNFPYPVVQVEGAEADDVIATIVMKERGILNNNEPILILSGDKDFVQLQKYGNVRQYDPVRNKEVKADDPELFLKRLVLTGDRGDGVPNVLSQDRCLVDGIRQKPLRETKIIEILESSFDELPSDLQRNIKRNELLIDLAMIPKNVQDNIIEEFESQQDKPRNKIFNYFIAHKMKVMMEHINEF